ncbi:MAG: RHS repeat-associated core domain-containing protein [Candidatus Edwardsbacteria bacterium]
MIGLANANGATTKYIYSKTQLRAILYLDGQKDSLIYYPDGNLKAKIDRKGQVIEYIYTPCGAGCGSRGWLTKKRYYDDYVDFVNGVKADSVVFEYDKVGNRTKMIDKNGTTTYLYDDFYRLKETTTEYNGKTTQYLHDLAGNRTEIKVFPTSNPSQIEFQQNYSYDQANRLGRTTCEGENYSFTYWDTGPLKQIAYPNNRYEDYTLTSRNLLKKVHTWKPWEELTALLVIPSSPITLFQSEYNYNKFGDRTSNNLFITKPVGGTISGKINYSYDQLRRLTKVSYPSTINNGQIIKYTYDPTGNRLSKGNSTYISYNYDIFNNHLLSTSDGMAFTYDANGNTVSDGVRALNYDFENRLSSLNQGNTTVDFAYNGDGQRLSKKTTTYYPGQVVGTYSFSEPFEDLIIKNPNGESHDDARDVGELKVHLNPNWLFFEIEHKYLYGTAQGEYSAIYIALDIDRIWGSGNIALPDTLSTGVGPESAWEYCVYVHSEDNFGIFDQNYTKYPNPAIGGKKMTVNYTGGGPNAKVIIKIPKELIGNPDSLRFVVMTTLPGFNLYGMSSATDVAPGGIDAVSGNVIYYSYPVPPPEQMPPYPGAPWTLVTKQYYHYDGMYAVLESEGSGGYKYIYANGLLLARINVATGEKHYYHHDGLGSVMGMTDVNGNVVQSYLYDEFGNMLSAYGVVPNSYLYTGQEWDVSPVNGYNLRARMYEPRVGRFGSEDPMLQVNPREFCAFCGFSPLPFETFPLRLYWQRDPQKLNAYLYVQNNSMNFIDPSGEIGIGLGLGIIGTGAFLCYYAYCSKVAATLMELTMQLRRNLEYYHGYATNQEVWELSHKLFADLWNLLGKYCGKAWENYINAMTSTPAR